MPDSVAGGDSGYSGTGCSINITQSWDITGIAATNIFPEVTTLEITDPTGATNILRLKYDGWNPTRNQKSMPL